MDVIDSNYVSILGYKLEAHSDWFILESNEPLSIRGRIVDGKAKDVKILMKSSATDIMDFSPEKAMAYAHKIISTAYFARSLENMNFDSAEIKKTNSEWTTL